VKALAVIFLAFFATDLPLPLWARVISFVGFAVATFILGINHLRRDYEKVTMYWM
jgi:hypothetical protein